MTSRSHPTMPRRRHSIATRPLNVETTRRRSMNSSPGGKEPGNPVVSGNRCVNSSANVGPRDVRRRVCATKIAAPNAHCSAESSPVRSSNTYAHWAGGGTDSTCHHAGYDTCSTITFTIAAACTSQPREATGSSGQAAHVQRRAEGSDKSIDCFVWPSKLCHTE